MVYISALATIASTALGDGPKDDSPVRFPAALTDIDGRTVDVARLAAEHHLVVVTLKAPWCPVCRQQLLRIRARLPELTGCGVTFLVLAPGEPEQLAAVRESTGFEFPFVADHGLEVARSLGLAMGSDRILPGMLQILEDRTIGWRQTGRNGAYFGDEELSEYFDCTRFV